MQLTEITRFEKDMDGYIEPHEDGQWVRYDDHCAAITRASAATVAEPGEDEPAYDFHRALSIADGAMAQYKSDHPKWWKRMDGTPILNDLPVVMARAFQAECETLHKRALKAEELNRKFMDSVNGPTHMGEPVLSPNALWGMSQLVDGLDAAGHSEDAQKWRGAMQAAQQQAEQHLASSDPEAHRQSLIDHEAEQQAEPWADYLSFQELCDMLPADVNWSDPITPDIVRHIVAQSGRREFVVEWIDTINSEPIELMPVLVSYFQYNNPKYPRCYGVAYRAEGFWMSDESGVRIHTPTHWMHINQIDAAPTQQQEK